MPVEHPAQHHLPQGLARVDVLVEELEEEIERRLLDGVGMGEHVVSLMAGSHCGHVVVHLLDLREGTPDLRAVPGVHDGGDATFLARAPERLPVGVVERRHVGVLHVAGQVHGGEVVVGDPVELGHRCVHVDAGSDRTGHEEAVHGEAERVGRPTVPALGARLPRLQAVVATRHVVEHVAEPGVAEVDQLGGDALTVHVGEPDDGVVEAVPVIAMRGLVLLEALGAVLGGDQVDRHRIDLVVPVQLREQIVEALGEVVLPELLRNSGVRITRNDDDLLVHCGSPPLAPDRSRRAPRGAHDRAPSVHQGTGAPPRRAMPRSWTRAAHQRRRVDLFDGLIIPSRRIPIPFGPQTVADVLTRGLAESPDQTALSGPGGSVTYRQLDEEANRAANALLALGVEPTDRVGASLPNDIDLVMAFLGAMRIGAIWVGVPRVFTDGEKRELAADCGLTVLLTDRDGALTVDEARTVVVDRDDPAAEWTTLTAQASARRPDVEIDPFAPAAISYTSGTTGRPKGVVHSQHNILVAAAVTVAAGAYLPDEPFGTVLPLTSLNILTINAVFAFQAGSRCAVGDARGGAAAITEWVESEQIVVLSLVPTLFQTFVDDPDVRPESMRSVTKPRAGGAPLTEALVNAYRSRFGGRICTSYGSTEILTFATREDPSDPHVDGSVGRPLPHVRVTLLDEDGHEVADGERGEICVGPVESGPWSGVFSPMLGYWQAPEATAAVLQDGSLRSGDVGRFDPDGHLHLVDRKKSLIIRGGSNIYPAEIERAFALDERVVASAVVPRPHDRLGEVTVAFVELAPGTSVSVDELRAHCTEHLARYKVPDEIRIIDSLPRNALGKVNRAPLVEAALTTDPD